MSESEAPYSPPDPNKFPLVGGIPLDLKAISLLPYNHVVVHGEESKDAIYVRVTKDTIDIEDRDNESYFFTANSLRDPEDEDGINHIVSFDIRTVTFEDGKRVYQPDFRALELATTAIMYFEEEHGMIDGIGFQYEGSRYPTKKRHSFERLEKMPPSDNYVTYFKVKEEKQKEYLEQGLNEKDALIKAQQDGALASWSGQHLAVPRGFTFVRDIYEYNNPDTGQQEVTGEFIRPK